MKSIDKKQGGLLLLLLSSYFAVAQLTIRVSAIPEDTPEGASIYVAGTFNNWDPGDENYRLTPQNDDTYQISFTPAIGQMEFKFTRGDWATVECDAQGHDIPNRSLSYSGGSQMEELVIVNWIDGSGGGQSTAAENVHIIDSQFWMPQLNRSRRIWIYLPPDYESSSSSYPVLYMQDGQNLFDAYTSFAGEWEVDESLNNLFANGDKGIIVVGVDNGGADRLNEYSPWVNPQYGGGQGNEYVDFLVETLKPYIDSHYRTKTDRLNTGIMGSSMGALISFYAAMEHQDVFSKVGVFSPSFWFSHEVYAHASSVGKQYDMSFYIMGGEQESETLLQEMNEMVETLYAAGFQETEIKLLVHADGQHSEWYWRREFPNAYLWLYYRTGMSVDEAIQGQLLYLHPNPFKDYIQISTSVNLQNAQLVIYNMSGELIDSCLIPSSGNMDMGTLKDGIYIFQIKQNGQSIFSQKIMHKK